MTRPRAGLSINRVSIPSRRRVLSLLRNVRTDSKPHPASYSFGIRDSFSGGKTVGKWSWPLTPSSVEVMNEWSHTTTPLFTFVACIEASSSLLNHIEILSKPLKYAPNQNWVQRKDFPITCWLRSFQNYLFRFDVTGDTSIVKFRYFRRVLHYSW
jgi:hypothetical protein